MALTVRAMDSGWAFGAPRVMLLIYSLSGGGAEAAATSLIRAWDDFGVGTDLVLAQGGGRSEADLPSSCHMTVLGCTTAQGWIAGTSKVIRHERPSAILAFMEGAGLTALIGRTVAHANTPVVVGVHNTLSAHLRSSPRWKERLLGPLLLRRLYPRADGIVAVSEGVAADLSAYARIPRSRIDVIYNPIVRDLEAFQRVAPPNHPWYEERATPVILAAGRFTRQKDYPTMLRAFQLVRGRLDARLVILGEGEERASIEALARALGVADSTAFVGFVANPHAYMRHSSVLALSSAWEGFGNVLVEAMACGTPVVSTDCPHGPREILDNGRYGTLVPVGDDRALAEAIRLSLDGVSEAERAMLMGRAAEFSVQRAAQQYLDVLGIRAGASRR